MALGCGGDAESDDTGSADAGPDSAQGGSGGSDSGIVTLGGSGGSAGAGGSSGNVSGGSGGLTSGGSGGSAGAATGGSGGLTSGGSGGSGPGGAAGGGGVTETGGSPGEAGSGGTAGADACAQGEQTPIGRLCVRGTAGTTGEELVADAPVDIQLEPAGCFSSACTAVYEASCTVQGTSQLTVTGLFCIGSNGQPCSLPDCSGGGFTRCSSEPLPAGDYTATLGTLSVSFTVPSTLPWGGTCDQGT